MYHSITIGNKNTWEDWRLIPAAPPMAVPAPIKKNFVDLPGGNGSIDLTRFIGNSTKYGMREGTWEFIISDQETKTREQWANTIIAYLHGQRFEQIIFEDDPGWYYSGLLEVSAVKPGKSYSAISIGYTLDPFKHSVSNSEVTSL